MNGIIYCNNECLRKDAAKARIYKIVIRSTLKYGIEVKLGNKKIDSSHRNDNLLNFRERKLDATEYAMKTKNVA